MIRRPVVGGRDDVRRLSRVRPAVPWLVIAAGLAAVVLLAHLITR